MTLEELKQEMIKRGRPKSQVNSKTVALVLDILADSGTAFIDAWEAEEKTRVETARLESERQSLKRQIDEYEKMRKATEASFAGKTAYIKDWYETIKATETAEGRDTMRKAQFYINEVRTIATPATYADGLARILASGGSFQINTWVKNHEQ